MLTYQLLKNNAGFLLIGDYTSLRALHSIIHDINDRSPLIRDRDGQLMNLAYEIRKAYEQSREVLEPPQGYEEMGLRYGTQQLLPVILLQARMMRASLAYFDHSKMHQAMLYALEDVVEKALRDIFKSKADAIIERWQWINVDVPGVFELLHSRAELFCSWTKSERRNRFLNLLETFDLNYAEQHRYRFESGVQGLPSPGEFALFEDREWPDPNW